jgi:hypothetical protein
MNSKEPIICKVFFNGSGGIITRRKREKRKKRGKERKKREKRGKGKQGRDRKRGSEQ